MTQMKKNQVLKVVAIVSIMLALCANAYAVQFYDTLGTVYENAVEILGDLSIVSGVKDNVFDPDREVTRAEFAKMLVECSLKKSEIEILNADARYTKFYDVATDKWYFKYVNIAVNKGFMQGFKDGSFRPDDSVTYAQIAKLVTKALGHDYLTEDGEKGWAQEYVDKMYEYNLYRLASFSDINDKATRGNCAIILWNMLTADTWKMIFRNDVAGFSYEPTGETLFDRKIIDHTYVLDATIGDFKEINGLIYARVKGEYYKLFDQKATVNFSMIGGTSDILFKRVEYPGKVVKYEIVNIHTDAGSKLVAGTIKELKEDGISFANPTRLSSGADYAFVYQYLDKDKEDRVVSINTSNFCLVKEVKIESEKEESKSSSSKDNKDDESKSHSSVSNPYEDDRINYRYDKDDPTIVRTILVNPDSANGFEIPDGAVLFRDNQRVEWGTLKKGDLLVEVTKDKYYMIMNLTQVQEVFMGYDSSYVIKTENLNYQAYKETMFTNYTTTQTKLLEKLSKDEINSMVGKKVMLLVDFTDRVIEMDLIEDEVVTGDFNVGFFESFLTQKEDGGKYASFTLNVEGKLKTYKTTLKTLNLPKGTLVSFTYDDKLPDVVKTVAEIKSNVNLSEKIKLTTLSHKDLIDELGYFDDDEIRIIKATYHYEYGDYEKPKGYDAKVISIAEAKELDENDVNCVGIMDVNKVYKIFIIRDYSEKNEIYYGLVTKIYSQKSKDSEKKRIQIAESYKKVHDYSIEEPLNCKEGEFVSYILPDKEVAKIKEKYTTDVMGYKKDLFVTSVNRKSKDSSSAVLSYGLNKSGKLDMEKLVATYDGEEYKLSDYNIFLIKVVKDENGNWKFETSSYVKSNEIKLNLDDGLAFNEIDNTLIIYRGYKPEVKEE